MVGLSLVIFTADRPRLCDSLAVVAKVVGAKAGPDGGVGVVLGALQAALRRHVDGVVGRAEQDALGEALSERTCERERTVMEVV